jgi:hypothetical protein
MNIIESTEISLIGNWISDGNKMEADKTCERIEWLIENVLKQVTTEDWEALFIDPNDGRYWERTYPQSEMPGGGPPSLVHITVDEAREKYKIQ